MIDTIQGMTAETGVAGNYMCATLYRWRAQGRAVKTDRVVEYVNTVGHRRKAVLWEVKDYTWKTFLNRTKPVPEITHLSPRDYWREAKDRYNRRVMHTKRVYRKLRRESFARRNPFVVLEDA